MSAAAPNPNNLVLYGVLGIAAYWMLTRPATGGTLANGQTWAQRLQQMNMERQWAAQDRATWLGVATTLGSKVTELFNPRSPAVLENQRRNAATAAESTRTTPVYGSRPGDDYNSDPTYLPAAAAADGILFNPPGNAAANDVAMYGWNAGFDF